MEIKGLVNQFRNAINIAKDVGEFDDDFSFYRFPHGCCGDTSCLLGQYLLENDIKTYYVYGTYRNGRFGNFQSHAWLQTTEQTIIDITGDQFRTNSEFFYYDIPVYIGMKDRFHRLFEVEERNIRESVNLDDLGGMCQPRLNELYGKIIKYIFYLK